MKRASPKSPLTLHQAGTLFLLIFSLTGAKGLTPGEIVLQEGVSYRVEGRQLQETGELERAASAFRKAIAVKPDYAEAYNDLGVILESLGEIEPAEEAYQTALKFKPDLGPAHSNLALLYEETNRVKEAAVHCGARAKIGPPEDPWVAAAREKLTKYQIAVPETAAEKVEKKGTEIRLAIETGKADMEAKRFDKAVEQFERALKLDPTNAEATRLLRSAKQRAIQEEGRQARELEAAKGRVKGEAAYLRREEAGRKATLEREWAGAQDNKRQVARQMKELEEARRRLAVAEQRAQQAEAQRQVEAAKRVEAEMRAEAIEKKTETDRKLQETEKARRQVEEAKRRSEEAERRAQIARKAAEAARLAAEAAGQTYEAARQTVEAARETEAMVKQTTPAAVPAPTAVRSEPSGASPEAQAIAREIARERSQVQGRASDELIRRAASAMREGMYQDAIETYKQILILEPNNRSAQQGLERAQKALAKEAQ